MKKKFFLIALSIVIMSIAFVGCDGNSGKNDNTTTSTPEDSSSAPLYTLPQNGGTTLEGDESTTDNAIDTTDSSNTGASISSSVNYGQPDGSQSSSNEDYVVGSYIVNTATDPLSLRLKPSAGEDNVTLRGIPKGTKITVIAVKDDWGYVVYSDTGGWVSMKFLKPAA